MAIAHNGNLTNAGSLRRDLVAQGAIFQSTSDTETIIHLAARSKFSAVVEKLIDCYLARREGDEERFIDTVRRIGLEPFKQQVYARTARPDTVALA